MCFKAEQAFDNHGVISMIKNESHVGIFGCIRQTSGLKEGGEGCSDGGQCPTVEQEMPQVLHWSVPTVVTCMCAQELDKQCIPYPASVSHDTDLFGWQDYAYQVCIWISIAACGTIRL